jgi:miniconductance mechanosensitive channel
MNLYLNVKGVLSNSIGLKGEALIWTNLLVMIIIAFSVSWLLWKISRYIFHIAVNRVASKTKTYWDDALVQHHFFRKLAYLIPWFFLLAFIPLLLEDFITFKPYAIRAIDVAIIVSILQASIAFLSATEEMLRRKEHLKDKPVGSYVQLGKIIVYIIFGVIILSVALNKSPIYFFSAMGAMTAIVLLVFKDTILGFVASIQIAANDMLREGDWVSMGKYGADGDVEQINLTTVKVRNFDKTITTIPTYAFISDSFKNWRGMSESEGRRIKRSVSIRIDSIHFCSPEMLDRFKKFQILHDFIDSKQKELEEYNLSHRVDKSELINGRRLTNIGVFRKYVEIYLQNNVNINSEMTCMVRQLAPSETGLPIEIYSFSADKDWVNYESIMADIFDHLLAVLDHFDLQAFQNPTGDFSKA